MSFIKLERIAPFKILWLIPIFLAVHNLEEFFILKCALPGPIPQSPEWMHRLLPVITAGQFAAALIVVTLIPCVFLIVGLITSRWRMPVLILIQIQVFVFLNIFVHVIGAFLSGAFSPGLVTAVLINFPFSLFVFRHAWKERWVGLKALALMFPIGLMTLGPGIIGLLKLMICISG